MAAVFMSFKNKPTVADILGPWRISKAGPGVKTASAPEKFLHYFNQPDRPQTRLTGTLENGWPFH
jgi:aspartate-semialdehyde dehydrogenase